MNLILLSVEDWYSILLRFHIKSDHCHNKWSLYDDVKDKFKITREHTVKFSKDHHCSICCGLNTTDKDLLSKR